MKKRPSMEEIAWTERYPLDVRHEKKKVHFSDGCIFDILCVNGDRLRIQCLKLLAANPYAGQEFAGSMNGREERESSYGAI